MALGPDTVAGSGAERGKKAKELEEAEELQVCFSVRPLISGGRACVPIRPSGKLVSVRDAVCRLLVWAVFLFAAGESPGLQRDESAKVREGTR